MIRINLRLSPAKPNATVRIGDVCNLYSINWLGRRSIRATKRLPSASVVRSIR